MRFLDLSPELQAEGRRILATPGSVALWHRWLDEYHVDGIQAWTDADGRFWLKDRQGRVNFPNPA